MDSDRIKGAARTSYGRLEEQAGRLTGDDETRMDGAADEAAGLAQEAIGQVKDRLRDAADAASTYADEAYRQGRRQVERGAGAINTQVETNPVMAILVACAAGYALGLIVRMSRR